LGSIDPADGVPKGASELGLRGSGDHKLIERDRGLRQRERQIHTSYLDDLGLRGIPDHDELERSLLTGDVEEKETAAVVSERPELGPFDHDLHADKRSACGSVDDRTTNLLLGCQPNRMEEKDG
jgi:hypothetical protein